MATGRNKQLRRRKEMAKLSGNGKPVYYVSPEALLPDGSVISCRDRWLYFTSTELRGLPIQGRLTTYSGGGYVANLGYNEETSWTVLADLHIHNWLDKQSRAVFAEFTVYNANVNLFATAFLYVETLPTGGVFPWADFKVFNGYRYSAKDGLQSMWAEMIFILFILYFTGRELYKMIKQRGQYFMSFFNIIEFILMPLYIVMFVLIIFRWLETSANIKKFQENPKDYVSFQYSATTDSALMAFMGVICFLLNIKFMRLMQFAKLFFVTGQVMKAFAYPLILFMIPFTLYFLLFAWCAHLGFGSQNENYLSIGRTITTQFLHIMGATDFQAVMDVNQIAGPIYYFAYGGFMVMIAFNMFMAIICESIDADYDEVFEKEAGDIQIIEYLIKRFKEIAGIEDEGTIRIDEYAEVPDDKLVRTEQLVTNFEVCVDRLDEYVSKLVVINNHISNATESTSTEKIAIQYSLDLPVENLTEELNYPLRSHSTIETITLLS